MRLVSWKDPFNGTDNRCVALVDSSDATFEVALNYRCRDDERDRIWYVDSVPNGAIITTATPDEAQALVDALAKELLTITRPIPQDEIRKAAEENAEQYDKIFKKAVRPAFIEGAVWALSR